MGNQEIKDAIRGIQEVKPFYVRNGILYKKVGFEDIQLPEKSTLPKFTQVLSPQGEFFLFEDTEVVDLSLVMEGKLGSIHEDLSEFFWDHPVPVVLRGGGNTIMISSHICEYLENQKESIKKMSTTYPPGTLFTYRTSGMNKIMRSGQELKVLIIPDDIHPMKFSRYIMEDVIDMVVYQGNDVQIEKNDIKSEEGIFDIFLVQEDDYWMVRLNPPTGGLASQVQVKASILYWKLTKSREALLSLISKYTSYIPVTGI